MHAQPHRYPSTTSRHARGLIAVTLTAALFALLAAIPTGWAHAAPATPSVTTIPVVQALTPTELDEVLSTLPVGDLSTTELSELLEKLPGIKGIVPSLGLGGLLNLQTALPAAITDLVNKGDTLGQLLEPTGLPTALGTELGKLLPLLGTLLGGNPTTKLTEALGAQTPSELVDSLLSTDPSQLLSDLVTGLTPANLEALLQGLLGTKMQTGFVPTTVEGAAETLGATTESLTKELNLPATTKALTAPLENGKILSLLDGLGGLSLTLLSSESPGSGGSGGSGGGSGGSGSGSGGSGSGEGSSGNNTPPAGPGMTTFLVSVPLAQAAPASSPTASASSAGKGAIKILSHRVRGKALTLVVQVPAAGKIALGGAGVRSLRHEAAKAERVTLRTTLTKAGTASLRKLRHHLKVTVKASFKQTGGPSSSAKATVVFA